MSKWDEKRVSLGGAIIGCVVTLAIGVFAGISWNNFSSSFLPYLGVRTRSTNDWSALDEVYSNLLVHYDGEIDNIAGYIHVSELFDPATNWRQKIKPVVFAPETLLANKMMKRLLNEKRSIAVVVDEFGGMAGLVTLEDLVEEIFGDIQDEHDKTRLVMRSIDENTYEFSGRCEITSINEKFDLDLPESEDYQTIAGYILNATGAIPAEGDDVLLGQYSFHILKKSANRLLLLRVTKI